MLRSLLPGMFGFALTLGSGMSAPVAVDSRESLVAAARNATPGTVIQIKPGTYPGGVHLNGLEGTRERPIIIEPFDSELGGVFFSGKQGGKLAIHLSGCSHVILRKLMIMDFPINGINADDGGDAGEGSSGLRFEFLTFTNIGPRGNFDGLKLSGIRDFSVESCLFQGWGGSAIDMVGCHDGLVLTCGFTGKPGYSQANGVQVKGGSSKVRVIASIFENAGQRAINLGGSTGLPYFRPADATWEAREVEVAGCIFQGSLAPIAWVGIDGGFVHHNTIYRPDKWVARILQENTDPRFVRCRNGRFENNIVVFDRRVRTFVNVGGNTEPETFTFRNNAWFDVDDPRRGPAGLPGTVEGNVVVKNPIPDPDVPMEKSSDPLLEGMGPSAYEFPTKAAP